MVHFGMFHAVYAIFLIPIVNKIPGAVNFEILFGAIPILFINTIFSVISDIKRDKLEETSGASLFFIPYLRVVPMHIFILFAFKMDMAKGYSELRYVLLLFIGLKTLSDLVMHIIVNKTWKRRRPTVIGDVL